MTFHCRLALAYLPKQYLRKSPLNQSRFLCADFSAAIEVIEASGHWIFVWGKSWLAALNMFRAMHSYFFFISLYTVHNRFLICICACACALLCFFVLFTLQVYTYLIYCFVEYIAMFIVLTCYCSELHIPLPIQNSFLTLQIYSPFLLLSLSELACEYGGLGSSP